MADIQTQEPESLAGERSSSEHVIELFSGLQELFDRDQVRKEVDSSRHIVYTYTVAIINFIVKENPGCGE